MPAQPIKAEEPKVTAKPTTEIKPEPVKVAPQPAKVAGGNLIDVVMPKMGESLQEGTILKWLKKPGDVIERDEMILEISTDKVDTEVPSPVAGILTELLAQEGQTVDVGSVIARINSGGEAVVPQAAEQTATVQPAAMPAPVTQPEVSTPAEPDTTEIPRADGDKFYSPLVRKIAEDEGVTLNELRSIKGIRTAATTCCLWCRHRNYSNGQNQAVNIGAHELFKTYIGTCDKCCRSRCYKPC